MHLSQGQVVELLPDVGGQQPFLGKSRNVSDGNTRPINDRLA